MLKDVSIENYYTSVYVTTRSKNGYVIWNFKVDTEKDKGTVLLDQNNAFEVND